MQGKAEISPKDNICVQMKVPTIREVIEWVKKVGKMSRTKKTLHKIYIVWLCFLHLCVIIDMLEIVS